MEAFSSSGITSKKPIKFSVLSILLVEARQSEQYFMKTLWIVDISWSFGVFFTSVTLHSFEVVDTGVKIAAKLSDSFGWNLDMQTTFIHSYSHNKRGQDSSNDDAQRVKEISFYFFFPPDTTSHKITVIFSQ